jgi:hypothetical protein
MEKVKRILALVGVILLLAMYGSTLVFAIIDNSDSMSMFKASIAATIIIPVLLWAYTLVFKLVKKDDGSQDEENIQDESHKDDACQK